MERTTRQSPIDICSQNICYSPQHCKPSEIHIAYSKGDCSELVTNDHGWTVKVKEGCQTTLRAEHLPSEYRLAQFHAHWSRDGSRGSEHLLDGKALSGEMHFVFWNTRYGTFDEALRHGDGLAVLGVFLQEGAANAAYQPLLDVFRQIVDDNVRPCQELHGREIKSSYL
uniref:Alpha-carbonic anhydrase domain-containing protein n=1 Tax=Steinernema glaseri TaxID=37863 RepID=A0A1I8AV44_9BILA